MISVELSTIVALYLNCVNGNGAHKLLVLSRPHLSLCINNALICTRIIFCDNKELCYVMLCYNQRMVRTKSQILRRMLDAPVPGKRRRGRQKTRWKDSCKRDMGSVGLKEEDVLDRAKWKIIFKTIPATPDDRLRSIRRRSYNQRMKTDIITLTLSRLNRTHRQRRSSRRPRCYRGTSSPATPDPRMARRGRHRSPPWRQLRRGSGRGCCTWLGSRRWWEERETCLQQWAAGSVVGCLPGLCRGRVGSHSRCAQGGQGVGGNRDKAHGLDTHTHALDYSVMQLQQSE